MSDDASDLIDVSIAQDGGVKKRILQEAPEGAKGPPPNGYEVTAHYTGTAKNMWRVGTCVEENEGILSYLTLYFRRHIGK